MPAVAPQFPSRSSLQSLSLALDYADFFRAAWHIIEPDTPLLWNWHLDYLCQEYQIAIERVGDRKNKIHDIVTNVPPRSLKSSVATIFLNAWAWTRWPWMKFITASYSAELANQHALKTRALVQSDWYRQRWPEIEMRKDQDRVSEFTNTRGGFRKAVGVGGSVTGIGGDVLLVDDPINPMQAFSEAHIQRAKDWYALTFQNRLNDHHFGLRMLIMQRLHEDDLTGYVLDRDPARWKHIRIPGEDSYDIQPPELEKQYVDGLFFPQRFTREDLSQFSIDYGSVGYSNQIGQAPAPSEGIIFKKSWFRRYDLYNPPAFKKMTQSWDFTFRKTGTSRVCGQVWGTPNEVDHYLIPCVREKLDYVETKKRVLMTSAKYPRAYTKLFEMKANGDAIASDFKGIVPGIIGLEKGTSKEENYNAASPMYEAGHVYVPEGKDGDDFIAEHLAAPRGRFNDQVDTACQYLLREKRVGKTGGVSLLKRKETGIRNLRF